MPLSDLQTKVMGNCLRNGRRDITRRPLGGLSHELNAARAAWPDAALSATPSAISSNNAAIKNGAPGKTQARSLSMK